jgi:cation transport regulator ChaB
MLGMKLVRLIEKHSGELSRELMEQVLNSEHASDFQKIPPEDLRLAATDLYRNLGEWLLQKREGDIASRFQAVATRRVEEGIRPHHMVWALMLTRDCLWRFLRKEAFLDSIVELHAELELQQLLNQFFDRAIYHAIEGYEHAEEQRKRRSDWTKAQELAVSIGLMSAPRET